MSSLGQIREFVGKRRGNENVMTIQRSPFSGSRKGVAGGFAVAICLFAAHLLLMPAGAQAQAVYAHTGAFGGTGSATGLFSANPAPQRIAVHNESGKLFVADRGNHRIQVFSPTPTGADFDFAFSDSATTNHPIGVAVDQNTGDVYVTAAGTTNAVVKFNPDDAADPTAFTVDTAFTSPAQGTGTGQIGSFQSGPNQAPSAGGIAVDPTTGDILIADPGRNRVQRFDSDGGYLDYFNGCSPDMGGFCLGTERPAFSGIRDLAVTATGDVIVSEVTGTGSAARARVDRFSGDGELLATLSKDNDPVSFSAGTSDNAGNSVAVAADLESGEVFVSSTTGSGFNQIPVRIFQFVDDVHVGDFSAPTNFNGYVFGLTAGGVSPGRLYAIAYNNIGTWFGALVPRVQVWSAIIPPTVSIDEPSNIESTEATLTGSVNPNGSTTTWHFEYRRTGASSWTQIPVPAADAGDGTDDVPVSVTAQGLAPNSEYEVRLVANQSGGIERMSPIQTFTTEPAPPAVATGTASFLSTSGATLTGQVNPLNAETTYHFELGTDTSYGEVVPAAGASAGDGGVSVAVTEPITGLTPDTVYHFRLVAENEFGDRSVGDDQVLTTLARDPGGIGPAREFEVVAGLPLGGIRTFSTSIVVADSGERARYGTPNSDPLVPGLPLPHKLFQSNRGPGGWSVAPVDLPDVTRLQGIMPVASSPELSSATATTTVGHDPDDQNDSEDLYFRVAPDGDLTWVTRSRLDDPGEPQTDSAAVDLTGSPLMSSMSKDGRTAVFTSSRRLLEEDTHPSGAANRLYKWTDDGSEHGRLQLVSIRPDGSVAAGATLGSPDNSPHAVSSDGSRVFWRDGTTIYAHIEGADPIEIGPGSYADATPDGSRVFYLSAGRVYAFDVDSETSIDLTGAAGVLGVAAVAESGDRVYFVADAVLDADPSPLGETPSSAGRNLYLLELGEDGAPAHIRFIAALGGSDWLADGGVWSDAFGGRVPSTNHDGSVLAFGSVESLTGQATGGARQLFVYDIDAHSLRCASCPVDGSPPVGHVNVNLGRSGSELPGTGGWSSSNGYKRLVASDGTVFFDTPTPLVAHDQNDVRDVYEYRHGEVRLITSGSWDAEPATVSGADQSGQTVFFLTDQGLAPQDDEPGTPKLYAARVGGGFPVTTPSPGCIGDECQEEAPAAPVYSQPATQGSAGGDRAVLPQSQTCERFTRVARRQITRTRRLNAQVRRLRAQSRRAVAGGKRSASARRLVLRLRKARSAARDARQGARKSRQRVATCRRAGR